MHLINKLEEDKKNALKERDTETRSVLSYIVAEIKRTSDTKNPNDEQCVKTIQKQIQSNKDILERVKDLDERFSDIEKLENENIILYKYLPEEVSKKEILDIINSFDNKNIGKIMGALKQYAKENNKILNGGEASNIIKGVINV